MLDSVHWKTREQHDTLGKNKDKKQLIISAKTPNSNTYVIRMKSLITVGNSRLDA